MSAGTQVRSGTAARGVTLIELLVVVAIGLLVLVLAVPAFNGLLAGQAASTAENQVQTALRAARDAARRGAAGEDTAVVVSFSPGGRTQLVLMVSAGRLVDERQPGGASVEREVFVPIPGSEPLELPRRWTVRGYAPAGWVDQEWYPRGLGARRYEVGQAAWVQAETGFFDYSVATPVRERSSFMVRFRGGTGELETRDRSLAVAVMPRESERARPPAGLPDWTRADLAANARSADVPDLKAWARRVLTAGNIRRLPVVPGDSGSRVNINLADETARRTLLGALSGDVVRVKGVQMLAVYDEQRLADDLGVRLNALSDSLMDVTADQWQSKQLQPRSVATRFNTLGGDEWELTQNIGRWIEGMDIRQNSATSGRLAPTQAASVFVVNRLTGQLSRVSLPPGVRPGDPVPGPSSSSASVSGGAR